MNKLQEDSNVGIGQLRIDESLDKLNQDVYEPSINQDNNKNDSNSSGDMHITEDSVVKWIQQQKQ